MFVSFVTRPRAKAEIITLMAEASAAKEAAIAASSLAVFASNVITDRLCSGLFHPVKLE
jgi:hypothetical protein